MVGAAAIAGTQPIGFALASLGIIGFDPPPAVARLYLASGIALLAITRGQATRGGIRRFVPKSGSERAPTTDGRNGSPAALRRC